MDVAPAARGPFYTVNKQAIVDRHRPPKNGRAESNHQIDMKEFS